MGLYKISQTRTFYKRLVEFYYEQWFINTFEVSSIINKLIFYKLFI